MSSHPTTPVIVTFSFSTVKYPALALLLLYIFDLICMLFLPSDEGMWDFSPRRGTADIWVLWFCRVAVCSIVCVVAIVKATATLDSSTTTPANSNSNNTAEEQDGDRQRGNINSNTTVDETSPLISNNNSNIKNEKSSFFNSDENLPSRLKSLDYLNGRYTVRSTRAKVLNIAFAFAFFAHVTSNIYIAIKSLEYRYDVQPSSSSGDGFSDGNFSTTMEPDGRHHHRELVDALDVVVATLVSTTITASTTSTTSSSAPKLHYNDSSIFGGPTPPPTWNAVLISLLIAWGTLELYAMHYFFAAVRKSFETEFDVPAINLIHPHALRFEDETVLSKCNCCNLRFKSQTAKSFARVDTRKFCCRQCDFYVCGACVDLRVQQWLDKKKVEKEKQKQQQDEEAAQQQQRQSQQQLLLSPAAASAADDVVPRGQQGIIASAAATTATSAAAAKPSGRPQHSTDDDIIIGAADRIVTGDLSKVQLIKEIFSLTKGFRDILLLGAIALGVGQGINIVVPKLQGDVIDAIIIRDMSMMKEKLILFACLGLGRLLLGVVRMYATMMASRYATNSIRNRVFRAILFRDMGFFDATSSGVLNSRLTSDTNAMISPLQTLVNQVFANVIVLVGATVMSFSVSWQLALLSVSILGPIVWLTGQYANLSRVLNRQLGDSLADSNNVAQEAFQNIRTVQSFGTERFEVKRYNRAMEQTVHLAKKNAAYTAGLILTMSSMDLLVWCLTLGAGGYLSVNHPEQLSVGSLITFQLYIGQLNSSYRGLADSLNQLTKAAGASERVFTIMRKGGSGGQQDQSIRSDSEDDDDDNKNNKDNKDEDTMKKEKSGSNNKSPTKKSSKNNKNNSSSANNDVVARGQGGLSSCYIKFNNIWFSYPTRPAAIVHKGLTLKFRPGEITALVAQSGGGKSTVLQLLLEFYRPQAGEILIGYKKKSAAAAAQQTGSMSRSNSADPQQFQSQPQQSQQQSDGVINMDRSDSLGFARSTSNLVAADDEAFYDESTFDWISLSEMSRRKWLRDVAVVSQEVQLFNSTIIENICYGYSDGEDDDDDDEEQEGNRSNRNDAPAAIRSTSSTAEAAALISSSNTLVPDDPRERRRLAKVIEAAKAAQAHEFISKLPDGYYTPIGERGSTLSGGEKSRLSIARALLRKPRVLLLDEATAALDNDSEAKVQATIDEMLNANKKSKSMTIIVIAHRLSSIKNADRILVLKDGQLLQEGTHDSLMRDGGLYSEYVMKGFPAPANKNNATAGGGGAPSAGAGGGGRGGRGGRGGGGGAAPAVASTGDAAVEV